MKDKYFSKIEKLLLRAMNLKVSYNLNEIQLKNEKDDVINKFITQKRA